MIDPAQGTAAQRKVWPFVVFAFAVLGVAAWRLWRASFESTLWMDEVYSLVLSQLPTPQLLDAVWLDFHPPGYYFALRQWLEIGSALPDAAALVWARSLNLLVWLLLVPLSLFLLRRIRPGSRHLILAASLVTLTPHALQFTQDLRSYGFAYVGLTVCFLLRVLELATYASSRSSVALWLGYVGTAVAAAWSHLLVWVGLFLLGMFWLVLRASMTDRRSRLTSLLPGLAAHGLVALSLGPWVLPALRQTESLHQARPDWMTPPSARNLFRVFFEWLPLGRDGSGGVDPVLGLLLGAAAVLPPLVLLALRIWRRPAAPARLTERVALGGFLLTAAFVFASWAGSRWFGLSLFHGPRYPCLVGGVWTTSIALLVLDAGALPSKSRYLTFLSASALLLAALLSGARTTMIEPSSGLVAEASRIRALAREHGAEIVFVPERLRPYFRRTLAAVRARPVKELPCLVQGSRPVLILNLNRWRSLDTADDLTLHVAIAQGKLENERAWKIPEATGDFELVSVRRTDQDELLARWCKDGIKPGSSAIPSASGVVVDAAELLQRDGWSYLEFDEHLVPYRWSLAERSIIRLPTKADQRTGILRLSGARTDRPTARAELVVRVPCADWQTTTELSAGSFDLALPVSLPRRCRDVKVEVSHPLWRVQPTDPSSRRLGVLIRSVVFEEPVAQSDAQRLATRAGR